jgi:hypothetical protein
MMEGEKCITDFFLEREMLRKWVVCTGFNWLRIVRCCALVDTGTNFRVP